MDLNIRIKKLEIKIHPTGCDKFICTVSPDMYLTGVECATKLIEAKAGTAIYEDVVWDFPIRPEFRQNRAPIPQGSGLRFTLYGSANSEAHRRHIADGVLYFHEIIDLGKSDGKHIVALLDYGLMQFDKKGVKPQEQYNTTITRGELLIHIENVRELLDRYVVEPATGFSEHLAETSKTFSAYTADVLTFYKNTPPLLEKYNLRRYNCFLYPSNGRNGISEPTSLLISVQQFVGPIYESVYLNGLLSSLWQLDMTPLEFMEGARDRRSVNDKYSTGYAKSVQAAATIIPTIAHAIPYGYDVTAEGASYDDPETQTLVREWDCEDGGMFSMRLVVTLMRFKDIWRCPFVKEAANLLVRHYVPVLATTVCGGVPQKDKIDPNHRENGHIVCILILKQYFTKLLESEEGKMVAWSGMGKAPMYQMGTAPWSRTPWSEVGLTSWSIKDLVQWPEWMYYSKQYPPPPCCTPIFVENWNETEKRLLTVTSPTSLDSNDAALKLSPILILESTGLSNVCGDLKEFYPEGEQIRSSLETLWRTPCSKWIQELHNSKLFSVSLNSPLCSNNSQQIALDTRSYSVSKFYNAIISLAVYSPSVVAKLDRALGRSIPSSIRYRNDTFVEACFATCGHAGTFFSALAIGDPNLGLAPAAYLPEAVCDCVVDAFLSNRPIIHPVGKETLSVGPFDFIEMVGKRNVFSIILSPNTQQLVPALPTVSYVTFVDPETKEEFKNTIQKFIV